MARPLHVLESVVLQALQFARSIRSCRTEHSSCWASWHALLYYLRSILQCGWETCLAETTSFLEQPADPSWQQLVRVQPDFLYGFSVELNLQIQFDHHCSEGFAMQEHCWSWSWWLHSNS